MKNKAALSLIEQVIMLLALTVAAAVCLQIFVSAAAMAKRSALQDRALQQAQSCGEVLKSTAGDLEEAALILDGTVKEGVLHINKDGITVIAEKTPGNNPLLGEAAVSVYSIDTQLYIFNVYWQEVAK